MKIYSAFTLLIMFIFCAASAQEIQQGPFQFEYDTARIGNYWKKARQIQQQSPDSAIHLLADAVHESKQAGYSYGTARSLAHLGTIYTHIGRYQEGIALLKESIVYAIRSPEGVRILPIIYMDLGGVYILTGDYHQASRYAYHAASLAEKIPSAVEKSNMLNNIAAILVSLQQTGNTVAEKDGLYYLDLAEQLARKSGNPSQLTTALINKGGYFLRAGHPAKSLPCLGQALGLARENGFSEKEHNVLLLTAQASQANGDHRQALSYLRQADSCGGNINPHYTVLNHTLTATSLFNLGAFAQAEQYLLKALELAAKLGLNADRVDIHDQLYHLYKKQKQTAQALAHHESYLKYKDSTAQKEVVQHINQLDINYRTLQKDKDLLERKLQIETQHRQIQDKNFWILISLSATVLFALLLAIVYLKNKHKRRLGEQKLTSLRQAFEIDKLKATIKGEENERSRLARELHDGIGGLLTAVKINHMVLGQQNKPLQASSGFIEVSDLLDTISREIRKTSHNLMPDILLTNTLPEAIQIYCSQIKSNSNLKIDLQPYGSFEDLHPDFSLIIYRMIQELVQNIVKHARATEVIIHILLRDSLISITVEDDGTGFIPEEKKDGMGLQSLRSRVAGLEGTVSIDTSPGNGTSVYIEIPLKGSNSVKSH